MELLLGMTLAFQPTTSVCAETLGSNTSTTRGVTLTSGAGVQGSYVTIGTTTFTWHSVHLTMGCASFTQYYTTQLAADVGGGTFQVLVPDIVIPATKTHFPAHGIDLPLFVPAGTTLAAATDSTLNTNTVDIIATGFSRGLRGQPGFHRCHALFTISSRHGLLLDPGAVAHTKSAWTQLIASTSGPVKALMLGCDSAADTTRTDASWLVDVAIGGSGSEQTLLSDIFYQCETGVDCPQPNWSGPYAVDIPAGTRLSARLQSDNITAGDRRIALSVYGFGS